MSPYFVLVHYRTVSKPEARLTDLDLTIQQTDLPVKDTDPHTNR